MLDAALTVFWDESKTLHLFKKKATCKHWHLSFMKHKEDEFHITLLNQFFYSSEVNFVFSDYILKVQWANTIIDQKRPWELFPDTNKS